MQVLHDEPVAPRQIASAIPKDLEAICLKCLEKDPSDRYATAADLATDLTQFLAGEPILAKNDLMRRLRKWMLREPVLAAHLAGIAARLGRSLKWDGKKEQIIGDEQANAFLSRPYRAGYEIEMAARQPAAAG